MSRLVVPIEIRGDVARYGGSRLDQAGVADRVSGAEVAQHHGTRAVHAVARQLQAACEAPRAEITGELPGDVGSGPGGGGGWVG